MSEYSRPQQGVFVDLVGEVDGSSAETLRATLDEAVELGQPVVVDAE